MLGWVRFFAKFKKGEMASCASEKVVSRAVKQNKMTVEKGRGFAELILIQPSHSLASMTRHLVQCSTQMTRCKFFQEQL